MHAEQRQRAHEQLKSRGVAWALFANPASVTWLTGFATPVPGGPNPFAGGPPLLWYAAGDWTLIVIDGHAAVAQASGIEVISYLGYTIDAPIDGAGQLFAALRSIAGQATRIAIEEHHVPLFLRAALPEQATLLPIDGALVPLRMRKTSEELEKLRRNFALNGIGQAAAQAAVQPGKTELQVWSAMEQAILFAAEERVALGNDCTVGRRAHLGGWPQPVTIEPTDSFVVDLSTQWRGYWSDSCATYYAGEPTPRQVELHRTIRAALEFAIGLVKPGAIAGEIDRQVREMVRRAGYPVYGHHTGHGIGVSGHEEPRLVPYNTTPLAPGMVLMLEPGVYFPGETGIRLEDAVLVTEHGAEVLTTHSK